MNILVVGGGLVGSTLAGQLSRDGHDVSLVESDPHRVRELSERLDVQVVDGNGATAAVLRRAGIERATLVVATSASDEVNMTVGALAARLFKVPRVVVRVRDPDHAEGFELLCREHPGERVLVNPEAAAVDRIFSLLEVPGALDVVTFFEGELVVAGFRIRESSDFAGLLVSHMNLLFAGTPTLVVAIRRGEDWIIPHGGEEIAAGDRVYFAFPRKERDAILQLVGAPEERGQYVMVAGAGRLALELAQRLEGRPGKVALIDEREERTRRAAERLREALVIRGSVTDRDLLEEEQIEDVSTFVAATDDYEVNLVAGLLARRLGARRVFVLVENPGLADLIGEVGLDAVVSPRQLAIGLILQHIRGARVHSVAALTEERVELVDAEAVAGTRLTSGKLAEIGLPRGVLIAALRRGEELLLPSGEHRVEPGDEILFITTPEQAQKLSSYLSP